MIKITMQVDGMMCGMCEAHVNDAIRKVYEVDKVNSSHSKKQTEIYLKEAVDTDIFKTAVENLGYKVGEVKVEEVKKKGLFSFLKK